LEDARIGARRVTAREKPRCMVMLLHGAGMRLASQHQSDRGFQSMTHIPQQEDGTQPETSFSAD